MTDNRTQRLLILDVDETLIHGAERELERPADFRVGPFHIYKRPYLDKFLAVASEWYTLAIWSSATIDYVSGIAAAICPRDVEFAFVWGRERCVQRMDPERYETVLIKDLRKVKRLGYDLRRILFVDDTPAKLQRNYGNAIYVSPFEGEVDGQADDELERLARYLGSIRTANNYRQMEKRGWRTHR
ncbi:MAG: HAD family hydrolase [Planctomycetota bacterium]